MGSGSDCTCSTVVKLPEKANSKLRSFRFRETTATRCSSAAADRVDRVLAGCWGVRARCRRSWAHAGVLVCVGIGPAWGAQAAGHGRARPWRTELTHERIDDHSDGIERGKGNKVRLTSGRQRAISRGRRRMESASRKETMVTLVCSRRTA